MSRVLDLIASLTGNATTKDATAQNNPPQFDNSKELVTTEAMKVRGHEYRATATFAVNTTLTASHAGSLVIAFQNVAAITFTLPAGSTFPSGGTISFLNASAFNVTVTRAGSDQINPAIDVQNSIVLAPGDTLTLAMWITTGPAYVWETTGGSAALPYVGGFGALLSANGYQKLPSGIILQWGSILTSAGGDTAVTFPTPFITAAYSITATIQSASVGYATAVNTPTLTGFNLGTYTGAAGSTRAAATTNWFAIGK